LIVDDPNAMDKNSNNCLVLDVGKTNVKIHVLDDYCASWHEQIGGI